MTEVDTYLVTGGTGFIGSHIVNKLVDLGKEVVVIANTDRHLWRIETPEKVEVRYIDIADYTQVYRVINDIEPDFIFHLAAYVNPTRELEKINKVRNINLGGTLNLLRSLNDVPYKLFINTGTCEEYGVSEVPFSERQKEKPVSPYSFSKVTTTYLSELFANVYDANIVTVRPFLTYGPTQLSKRLLPSLIRAGLKKEDIPLTPGEQTRDFIYVEDVAGAYLRLSNNYSLFSDHEIFNIGTGTEVQIKEVVKEVSQYFPEAEYKLGALSYREGETMHFYSSIDKIKSIVGWQPRWSFSDGIKQTIGWWKNNTDKWELSYE